MAAIFPDNTVLINFACIDQLALLEGWLDGRGRWTEAVAYEASRSASYWPHMMGLLESRWLGAPIEPDAANTISIERLRRNVFGGTRSEPLKHLGESQTCYLLLNDPAWKEAWWISDDKDAHEFAKSKWITTRRTIDVFKNLVAGGDLTAPTAFDLMQSIAEQDRHLELPKAPDDLLR